MKKRNWFGSVTGLLGAAVVGLALAASSTARAAVIAYEGFDLGIANGTNIDGAAGGSSSTGFTGTWETKTQANADTTNMTYQSSGLAWNYVDPAVSVVGGAVNSAYVAGGSFFIMGGRQLPALAGSTVWGSFLTNGSTLSGAASQLGLAVGGTTLPDYEGEFSIETKGYNAPATVRIDATGTRLTNSGNWMSEGTTYLTLFKIDNINIDGGVIDIGLWRMTQAQYDNLIYGGSSESALITGLNSVALGTGADQLTARVLGSVDLNPGNDVSWAAGNWLRMINYVGGNDVTFDELRMATDLYGAAAIPEPSSLGLLAVSALLALRRRRWRRG